MPDLFDSLWYQDAFKAEFLQSLDADGMMEQLGVPRRPPPSAAGVPKIDQPPPFGGGWKAAQHKVHRRSDGNWDVAVTYEAGPPVGSVVCKDGVPVGIVAQPPDPEALGLFATHMPPGILPGHPDYAAVAGQVAASVDRIMAREASAPPANERKTIDPGAFPLLRWYARRFPGRLLAAGLAAAGAAAWALHAAGVL